MHAQEKQIGWSQEAILLQYISKLLSRQAELIAKLTASTSGNPLVFNSTSFSTSTLDANGVSQSGKLIIVDATAAPITITVDGGVTASYAKFGTNTITFVQGVGRTLVQVDGVNNLVGNPGSTASLWSVGLIDYVRISNA